TEIVEGVSARRDQLEDPVEPPCRPRDLECGSRAKPEGGEPGDQRNEQLLVARVVGDIQNGILGRVSLGDRSASASAPPPRSGLLLASTLCAASQRLGDHSPELSVALGRDTEHPSRRGGRGVWGRDYRTRS